MGNSSTRSIKRSSDFIEIKEFGQRFTVSRWLVANYIKKSCRLRYGITASRKVGTAVVRNKLKRWVREYFGSLGDEVLNLGFDINFIFKPMEPNFYKGLSYDEFKKVLDKLIIVLRTKS